MQNGQNKTDRWLVGMVREICEERHIDVRSFSDDWLLELKKGTKIGRILGSRFSLNDSVASGIARDKVAAFQLLQAYGISAIPHFLVRTNTPEIQRPKMAWQDGVVVKPLLGMGGRKVRLFYDAREATIFMESDSEEAWAISPLADIKREVRIIMLDGTILLAYEKQPVILKNLRVFNLSLGATPTVFHSMPTAIDLAHKTQQLLGLRLLAVDVVELPSGAWSVLEVNDSIAMEKYSSYGERNKTQTKEVYRAIVETMMN